MLKHIVSLKSKAIGYDLESSCMPIYWSMGRALRARGVTGKTSWYLASTQWISISRITRRQRFFKWRNFRVLLIWGSISPTHVTPITSDTTHCVTAKWSLNLCINHIGGCNEYTLWIQAIFIIFPYGSSLTGCHV